MCNCIIATTLVPLTQGKYAAIDNEDADEIMQHKWYVKAHPQRPEAARIYGPKINRVTIRMHRQIIGLEHGDGMEVDHINHNTLDNRRCNLRVCSKSQNQRNQLVQSRKKYSKGVIHRDRTMNPWDARIKVNGKCRHIGCYATEQEAADAYDAAARKHFGEFAYTNYQARQDTLVVA